MCVYIYICIYIYFSPHPEEGNGSPLQFSRLENPMDRRHWQATVAKRGCKESDTTEQLNTFFF